jgi:signal peptidase I
VKSLLALLLTLLSVSAVQAQERRVHAYVMQSTSMEPTLRVGERVMADRGPDDCGDVEGVVTGDIVVRRRGSDHWISRVVAGPGQTVELRAGLLVVAGRETLQTETGRVLLGGYGGRVFREEPGEGKHHHIFLRDGPAPDSILNYGPVRLGPDQWFLLGDNRLNAIDSREDGPVASADICGVLTHLFLSTDPSRVGPLR